MSIVQGTKAKRGQLFVFEMIHSAYYLRGGRQEIACYGFGKVVSVSRGGAVTRYITDDNNHIAKGRPAKLWLIPSGSVDEAALWSANLARFPRDFQTLEEARAFALSFKRAA